MKKSVYLFSLLCTMLCMASCNEDPTYFELPTYPDEMHIRSSVEEIRKYIVDQTTMQAKQFDENFTGLYAYVNGEYLDGLEWTPPEGYDPTERDWYKIAVAARGEVVIVSPYVDAQTGSVVITVARSIAGADNSLTNVVALDVIVNHIKEVTQAVEHLRANLDLIGILLIAVNHLRLRQACIGKLRVEVVELAQHVAIDMELHVLDNAMILQVFQQVPFADSTLLGNPLNEYCRNLVGDNHLRQLAVDFSNQFGGKVGLVEVNNIIQQKRIAAAITIFIYRQTESTPHLLQLANLTTAAS